MYSSYSLQVMNWTSSVDAGTDVMVDVCLLFTDPEFSGQGWQVGIIFFCSMYKEKAIFKAKTETEAKNVFTNDQKKNQLGQEHNGGSVGKQQTKIFLRLAQMDRKLDYHISLVCRRVWSLIYAKNPDM